LSYSEDDLLPISALQHLLFCERQCALIHLERLWADNLFTAEGNHLHEKAHTGDPETRNGVRITRGLSLQSFELGLFGQADVIEWEPPPEQRIGDRRLADVLRQSSSEHRRAWRVTPVEYKRGKPKENDCDRVQLCAQAMCLEEMLGIDIPQAFLFYGQPRRRTEIQCDVALRAVVQQAATRLHQMMKSQITPSAQREKKCDSCSLLHFCLPDAGTRHSSVRAYLDQMLR